jgi:pyruvate/2-oxoglutarate dehydrogenase complex dihydrolipoamide acyltransferase (E2) component
VKVGTEIAVVERAAEPGDAGPDGAAGNARAGTENGRAAAAPAAPAGGADRQVVGDGADAADAAARRLAEDAGPRYSEDEARRRSSPLVRRLAKEHAIDLRLVTGTGTNGRVTKDDMLAYIEQHRAASAPAAAAVPTPARQEEPSAPETAATADEEVLTVSPMRRAIAEHMVRSVTTAPHAWTYVEVDVSGLVKWREAARAEFERREGFALTYVPFVAKALIETLGEHPIMNSTWRGGQIVLKRRVHLGVAVALPDGLLVPVIRDADEKNVVGLARALNDLVTRARGGRLTPADVQGDTISLNNTGALGSVLSMPIINQPQAAIVTMEAITKRAVVTPDDAIAVRPMMNVCLSFDHRVCDGVQACAFLQALKRRLEALAPGGSLA